MLAAGEFVFIELPDVEENEDYPQLTFGWNNKEFTILRGKKMLIPFEAACIRFGDPRSGDKVASIREPGGETTGWIPDRKSEVARVRLLWGAHADNYPRFDDISIPLVYVTDMELEPVTMVTDDPEGNSVTPVLQTADDRDALLAMLDRQQAQIDKMKIDLGLEADISNEAQLPTDDNDAEPMFVGSGGNQ